MPMPTASEELPVERDKIFDNQKRIADPNSFADLWVALNESIGLERFVPKVAENDQITWNQLLAAAIERGESIRREQGGRVCNRRAIANQVVEEMVCRNNSSASPNQLRELYTRWERLRSESGKPSY